MKALQGSAGVEDYARHVTELATRVGADAVVGFSMGAVVAVEDWPALADYLPTARVAVAGNCASRSGVHPGCWPR